MAAETFNGELEKMNKALLGSVSAIAISLAAAGAANAQGAGGPWTGPYFGAHIGYGWTDMDSIFKNTSTTQVSTQSSNDGLLVGAHGGYNWQFDQFVFGIEVDASKASWSKTDRGQTQNGGTSNSGGIESNVDMLASIRARLGFDMGSNLLPYVTGGLGYVEGNYNIFDSDEAASKDFSSWGGVLGAGLDYRVSSNVTVGGEGLYYMFNEKDSVAAALPSSGVAGDKFKLDNIFVLRLRASYNF